jgi:hypothetical protein
MLLRRLTILCLGLLAITASAQACPDHAAKSADAGLAPRTASALVAWKPRVWHPAGSLPAAGLRVAIDPVDGAIGMPTADAFGVDVAVGEQDLRPVSMLHRVDGSIRAQLDERWESHAVATLGPDGKPRWTCVDGLVGVQRFLQHPVIPAPVSSTPVPEDK